MFSADGFIRLNLFLRGVWRLAYLNLLWTVTTALGLVVFGVGPASYAVAAYVDRWFRFGDTPAVAPAFFGHVRAQFWRSAAAGWIILGAGTIILVNLFTLTNWLLQFANVVALIVLIVATCFVFPVMAATDIRGVFPAFSAGLLLAVGSLHWTITAGAAAAAALWALSVWALPALLVFGIGIPAAATGFVTRYAFARLTEDTQDTTSARIAHQHRPLTTQ